MAHMVRNVIPRPDPRPHAACFSLRPMTLTRSFLRKRPCSVTKSRAAANASDTSLFRASFRLAAFFLTHQRCSQSVCQRPPLSRVAQRLPWVGRQRPCNHHWHQCSVQGRRRRSRWRRRCGRHPWRGRRRWRGRRSNIGYPKPAFAGVGFCHGLWAHLTLTAVQLLRLEQPVKWLRYTCKITLVSMTNGHQPGDARGVGNLGRKPVVAM